MEKVSPGSIQKLHPLNIIRFQRVKLVKRNLFLLLCFLYLTGCSSALGQPSTPTPIPTPAIPVKPTYDVQRGDIVESLRFTGRIAPIAEHELAFGIDGRVDQVLVKTGDAVQVDDLLAALDTGSQAYDLRRAQARVETAEQEHDLATQQMPITRQTYNLALSTKAYQVELAQMNLDRLKSVGTTAVEVRRAEIELALVQDEYNLAQEQMKLDLLAAELDLVRKENELELAKIALDELEAFISNSQIVAPITGQVVSSYLQEETAFEAFRTAIILADISTLIIRADPDNSSLQRLEEGMHVAVEPIGRPGTILAGYILSLPYPYGSGESGQDEAYLALDETLTLEEYDLGDLMEITVILSQKDGILWLPPQAIRTFEGRKFVVIQDGEGQRRVDVAIGIQTDSKVEILEGLQEGQVVFSP